MIARPALPAVLAALLDCRPGEETPAQWLAMPGCALALGDIGGAGRQRDGARFVVPRSPNARFLDPIGMGRDVRRSWITRDPAEAWEILDARGLLPPEGARGFWCTPCDSGRSDRGFMGCPACALTGNRRAPATIPDLVAWASLGADAIVTAEALAVEACAALQRMGAPWAAAPCERVVWRVAHKIGGNTAFESLRAGRAMASDGRVFLIDDEVVMPTQEFVTATKALSDMGIMLELVGAECVLCVPPIGGAT